MIKNTLKRTKTTDMARRTTTTTRRLFATPIFTAVLNIPARYFLRQNLAPGSLLEHLGGSMSAHAAQLRRIRRRRGSSNAEIADLAGIARATLSNIEAGRCKPSVPALARLLVALEVSDAEIAEIVRSYA
jgi:DNA-binding XRE family transcriptional regulator